MAAIPVSPTLCKQRLARKTNQAVQAIIPDLRLLQQGILDLQGQSELTHVTIPSGVHSINFSDCAQLRELIVPFGVEEIILNDCTALENLVIPLGIKTISVAGCTALRRLDLPSGVERVYMPACVNLEGATKILLRP